MDLRERVVRMGVDGTGSGSCPVVDFGISGVETSGSAARVSSLYTDNKAASWT
jgi:hypothetical protein